MKFYGEDQSNEQNSSQGYGDGYYQHPQQGYGNGYYQHPQQGYGNENYQHPQQTYGDSYYQNQQQYGNGYYQRPPKKKRRKNTGYEGIFADEMDASGNIKPRTKAEITEITNIFVVLGSVIFVSIGILIVGFTGQLGWGISALGIAFTVCSAVISAGKRDKKGILSLMVFPFIGLSIIVFGILMILGISIFMYGFMDILPYIIMGVSFISGISMIIATPVGNIRNKNRCTVPIQVMVVDRIHRRRPAGSRKGSPAYYPVYEYQYNGVVYTKRDDAASNIMPPEAGDIMKAYVNPNDPSDIYVVWRGRDINSIMCGIGFMSIPIIVFLAIKGII